MRNFIAPWVEWVQAEICCLVNCSQGCYNDVQPILEGCAGCVAECNVALAGRKDKPVYRYKGFDSAQCGDSISALEGMVNAWMEAEQPRIRHMCQSTRGNSILLSFVYEETRELERRLSAQRQSATLPRFFDDDDGDERPTSPQIPITPTPMQAH